MSTAATPAARAGLVFAVMASRIPVLAATRANVTSQTPPAAASARKAGCCHWLAPRTAHGPPMPCHDLIHSVTSHALGTTVSAAAARRRVTGGRVKAQTASPTAVHRKPSTIATSRTAGPRLGVSQYMAASR